MPSINQQKSRTVKTTARRKTDIFTLLVSSFSSYSLLLCAFQICLLESHGSHKSIFICYWLTSWVLPFLFPHICPIFPHMQFYLCLPSTLICTYFFLFNTIIILVLFRVWFMSWHIPDGYILAKVAEVSVINHFILDTPRHWCIRYLIVDILDGQHMRFLV